MIPIDVKELSILDFDDYRAFLRALLEQKRAKNSRFSLRALARLGQVSPSHLSRTLRGEKTISASVAHQFSMALDHTSREADHFADLVEYEKSSDDSKRAQLMRKMSSHSRRKSRIVNLDAFRIIADWYHFALLELTNTRGFEASSKFISSRLGIQPLEAKLAWERLNSMGFIEKVGSRYKAIHDAEISTPDDIASPAIRENHVQHLRMAEQALTDLDVSLREFNNITLAMNAADLPKAKKRIRDFIDDFNRDFSKRPGDEIYHLDLQFYRVSQPSKSTATASSKKVLQ